MAVEAQSLTRWPEGASAEYMEARRDLLRSELALVDQMEEVAAQRRALPIGPAVSEYVFSEGPRDLSADGPIRETRLSQLVPEDRSLLVYHMMFSPGDDEACPMCSMWVDSLHGVSHHLARRVDFVVVSKAPLEKLRGWARERGWDRLRILSSSDNSFNTDFGMETDDGEQLEGVSVFVKRDGRVHHFYTARAELAHDRRERGMDLLVPVWHVWDLVPEGRDDWYSSNEYAGRDRG